MTCIIAGSSNPKLAKKIAAKSNLHYIAATTVRYADGELQVSISSDSIDIVLKHVFILQSLSNPVNDNLIELLLIAEAVRRYYPHVKITAIIPYLGYCRQDKISESSSSLLSALSASMIASLIQAVGINNIITMDLHSVEVTKFFKIPVHELKPKNLFTSMNRNVLAENSAIIAPDYGAITRAQEVSNLANLSLAYMSKVRESINKCRALDLVGEVSGKHCTLIDDIVDTGGTLIEAAKLLMLHGATSVEACVTHAILSGDARQCLVNSPIQKIYVTDTIVQNNLPPIFQVISESSMIAQAVKSVLK